MKKLDFKIFRFDSLSDYEFYYKPYIYDDTFSTIKELLFQVKKDDVYFDFDEDDEYVSINQYFFNINEKIKNITSKCGYEFTINPLSTKYAKKDLIIDDSEFIKNFNIFRQFIGENELEEYKKLKIFYYSSAVLKYHEQYIGDSAIIFAYNMIKKYPKYKIDILHAISNPENGIQNYIKNKFFPLADSDVLKIKSMLIENKILKGI